jgi:hypothetical protein
MMPIRNFGADGAGSPAGGALFRDAAAFHGKLLLYGFCDLLLFPVAMIAVAVDVVLRSQPVGRYFYSVVHFGKAADDWLNLFGAADRAPESVHRYASMHARNVDGLLNELESKLRAGYDKGDISA